MKQIQIERERYLSIGSGIGRHIALAHETFPEISHVTAIDWKTPLHPSVLRLGLDIQVSRMIAFDVIEKLASNLWQKQPDET